MLQLLPKSLVITERSLNMMSAQETSQVSLAPRALCWEGWGAFLGTWQQASNSLCFHAHPRLSASPRVFLLTSEGSGVQVRPSALWKLWGRNPWEYFPPHKLDKYKRVADAGKSRTRSRRGSYLLELCSATALVDTVPSSPQIASCPPTCTWRKPHQKGVWLLTCNADSLGEHLREKDHELRFLYPATVSPICQFERK